jgi:hypothetical protein
MIHRHQEQHAGLSPFAYFFMTTSMRSESLASGGGVGSSALESLQNASSILQPGADHGNKPRSDGRRTNGWVPKGI